MPIFFIHCCGHSLNDLNPSALLPAPCPFYPLTDHCAKCPEPACPEFIERVEGLTAY